MSDRVYKDIKVFVERSGDGKKVPLVIGYAYEDGGKTRINITAFPPPGAKCDWSGVIEDRQSRLSVSADRRAPSTSRPAWGASGHGNSAKHATGDDGGGDGYGDGTADAYHDANDDVPFISQRDDIRARLR